MAAVLRSAARRLAGELPAAEMGLHRLPFPRHSQVSVWSASSGRSLLPSGPAPSSLSKAKPAMESAICPPFIPRRTMSTCFGRAASQPLDKTKVVIESAFRPLPILCRTMSTSSGRPSSHPANMFCFYMRGARMETMLEPGPEKFSTIVFRETEEESLNEFWSFMRMMKKNEFERAKENEYIDMQLAYNEEWRKAQNLPWFRKLQKLEDHILGRVWPVIPGCLLLAGLGESLDWKLAGGPNAPPPGPGEETPSGHCTLPLALDKFPIEDMF